MKNLIASALILASATGSMLALNCQRSVKAMSSKEVKVEITISKDDIGGFARLSELIPAGAEIKYAKAEGGTFDIQHNKLKFIWLALPKKNVVTVTYIVKTESLKEGDYMITGKFCYVDGDQQTKEFVMPSSAFNINSKLIASVDKSAKAVAPSHIITYGLQLISTKDKLPADYFSKNFQIKETVQLEEESGLNKYIIGEFKSSEEAAVKREAMEKEGFKGAFVVAYYNNMRVTLSEAKNLEGSK
jgi:hypothetical protein